MQWVTVLIPTPLPYAPPLQAALLLLVAGVSAGVSLAVAERRARSWALAFAAHGALERPAAQLWRRWRGG